jgi:hypothetical protein
MAEASSGMYIGANERKCMMRKNFRILCLVLMLLLSACNLGVQPVEDSVAIEDVATETAVVVPQVDPTATAVQHVLIPGELPELQRGVAGDQDSSTTADQNRAPAGDRFTLGRYERPFNANAMDIYFSNIDIVISEVYEDETWVYGVITIKDNGQGCSFDGKYGFELDWDINGGGDLLVLASKPTSTEWSTAGVEVWFDENDDVGGALKTVTDESPVDVNGYETQFFGAGVGDDPDLAWARISSADPCVLELAVKRTAVDGSSYLIGMWAGNALLDPAMFDHNDRFSHEQAGSSLTEFEFFYPVKEVYELDNVCKMAVGFQPNGSEPGVCPVPPGPQKDAPPPPPGQSCPAPSILYCSPNGCFCLYPQG